MSQSGIPKYNDISGKKEEVLETINEEEENPIEEETKEELKNSKGSITQNKNEQKSDDEFRNMIKDISNSNYSLTSVSNVEEKEIDKKDIAGKSDISKNYSNKNIMVDSPPYDFLFKDTKNDNELENTLQEKYKGKIIILNNILI